MSAVHFVKETQQFQSKIDILKNVITKSRSGSLVSIKDMPRAQSE